MPAKDIMIIRKCVTDYHYANDRDSLIIVGSDMTCGTQTGIFIDNPFDSHLSSFACGSLH